MAFFLIILAFFAEYTLVIACGYKNKAEAEPNASVANTLICPADNTDFVG